MSEQVWRELREVIGNPCLKKYGEIREVIGNPCLNKYGGRV